MGIWMQPANLGAKTKNAVGDGRECCDGPVLSAVLFEFLSDFEFLGRWIASEINQCEITST